MNTHHKAWPVNFDDSHPPPGRDFDLSKMGIQMGPEWVGSGPNSPDTLQELAASPGPRPTSHPHHLAKVYEKKYPPLIPILPKTSHQKPTYPIPSPIIPPPPLLPPCWGAEMYDEDEGGLWFMEAATALLFPLCTGFIRFGLKGGPCMLLAATTTGMTERGGGSCRKKGARIFYSFLRLALALVLCRALLGLLFAWLQYRFPAHHHVHESHLLAQLGHQPRTLGTL